LREVTIARNYAEALFALGERSDQTERFADLLEGLAGAIEADRQIRLVLVSPRIPKPAKSALLRKAMSRRAPEPFLRFLDAVVKRSRQVLLPAIAAQYRVLVDAKFHRAHAGVTLAREPDAALRKEIRRRLSDVFARDVIPHFREDPDILGGIVVRMGDRVMDGSIRRRLVRLKRQMLG
jgi:F-type H+-transporting ATPase subunit delta